MTHRRTRILLATSLSLALLGLVPGPTATAAPPAPALTAPTAVTSKKTAAPSKKNVITMKPGKTYKVKMNGKTHKVKWTSTCIKGEKKVGDYVQCETRRERLYVNSKKVLTRYSTGYDLEYFTYVLAKVTSKETLVSVEAFSEAMVGVNVIYRFNGKKLVKVADRKSVSKKLRDFDEHELYLTKAGSGKLTLRYGYSTNSGYGYRNITFKYSKGKLK